MSAINYDTYPKALQAVELIAGGRTQTSACREAGITVAAFRRCMRSTPELAEALGVAEQQGYDALADTLLEIDSNPHYGSSDPKQQKVISDNIKWLLSRRDSKRFGDRMAVDVTITADKAVVAALSRARDRALTSGSTLPVIDVVPDDEDVSQFI